MLEFSIVIDIKDKFIDNDKLYKIIFTQTTATETILNKLSQNYTPLYIKEYEWIVDTLDEICWLAMQVAYTDIFVLNLNELIIGTVNIVYNDKQKMIPADRFINKEFEGYI